MYFDVSSEEPNENPYSCQKRKDVFCVSHIHYDMEIIFVLGGEIMFECNSKKLKLTKNDMAIVMPYEIHGFETPKHSDILVITFRPEQISEYNDIFAGKTFETSVRTMPENILSQLEGFLTEKEKNIFEIKSMLYGALSVFIKDNALKSISESQNETLRQALIYISKHYREDINLKIIASKIGVTPVHLSRIISSSGTMHFTDLVNCLRVKEAYRLLKQNNMSVSDAAYESGFGSIRNFNRIFEKYFHCSPRDVKNKSAEINFLIEDNVILL